MKEFLVSKHSIVRLWINSTPFVIDFDNKKYSMNIDIRKINIVNRPMSIAVEAYLPSGGRIKYGLLGVDIKYEDVDSLNIDIVSPLPVDGEVWEASLLSKYENAYIGLPEEYYVSVISGIRMSLDNITSINGNRLVFNCAAYSKVGSSNDLFLRLSYIIGRFLEFNYSILNDDNFIFSVVKEILYNRDIYIH